MVTEARSPVIEEKAVDFGAAIDAAIVEVGDRFGLYKAIADAGPVSAPSLRSSRGCRGASSACG